MAELQSYSQQLRPLGQQLEALGIERFSVRLEADGYRVAGTKRYQPPATEKVEKSLWQRIREGAKPAPPPPAFENVDLHFTFAELERIDAAAQRQRSAEPAASDAHSPSQILRAVGAMVEQKQGRFLAMSKADLDLVIEYESATKGPTVEKFTTSSLYDFWVKMYLRRSKRG